MTMLDDKDRAEMGRDSWQFRAVAATRGSQSRLGAILLAVLGKQRQTLPRFASSAVITSDGFVMAGFCDKAGRYHHGALVCDVSELVANFRGLADHLKLNDADRVAMFAEVQKWCATDYRARKSWFG